MFIVTEYAALKLQSTIFSFQVFQGWISTKQIKAVTLKCLTQGHKAVYQVRLEPGPLRLCTLPLRSSPACDILLLYVNANGKGLVIVLTACIH